VTPEAPVGGAAPAPVLGRPAADVPTPAPDRPAADVPTAAPVPRRGVVALGANLGDRVATLRAAVRDLDAVAGVRVVAGSSPVESVALTPDGLDESRPAYVNAVVLVDVTLDDLALLDALQAIEDRHGRVRAERWGDRTLDLDLVDLEGSAGDGERLVVPHPRAAERSFVLEPWLEVDPDARLAGAGAVAELLAALPDRVRRLPGEAPLAGGATPALADATDATGPTGALGVTGATGATGAPLPPGTPPGRPPHAATTGGTP